MKSYQKDIEKNLLNVLDQGYNLEDFKVYNIEEDK